MDALPRHAQRLENSTSPGGRCHDSSNRALNQRYPFEWSSRAKPDGQFRQRDVADAGGSWYRSPTASRASSRRCGTGNRRVSCRWLGVDNNINCRINPKRKAKGSPALLHIGSPAASRTAKTPNSGEPPGPNNCISSRWRPAPASSNLSPARTCSKPTETCGQAGIRFSTRTHSTGRYWSMIRSKRSRSRSQRFSQPDAACDWSGRYQFSVTDSGSQNCVPAAKFVPSSYWLRGAFTSSYP